MSLCCFNMCSFLFLDTGTFTTTFALIKKFGSAYTARLIEFNGLNIGRIIREYPFYTDTIRDLANSKSCRCALSLFFQNITFKRLDPFFRTFYDLIINGNIITWFELREFFGGRKLLMNK